LRSTPAYRFKGAVTFDPTVGSPSTFLQEFLDAVFHAVDVESLLGEAEVSAL
jgi:hypothetical protein